ncbi:ABC transporter ATP-binding protein [Neisseriaceae bacterium TC5R-5]|nr:ABC transporter ATP-binding protein [Neisseriaceae bacterium TC5R-5]
MPFNDIAIRITNLSKHYQVYDAPRDRLKQFVMPRLNRIAGKEKKQYFREFSALMDISFDVKKGEIVGIIGRNGSGKSTLLQIICGTLTPTSGAVQLNGRVAALLELGSGFNPEFTGRENVYMNASVLGLSKEEIDTRFEDIVSFADIGDFIDQLVKTYSSGMYVRLAFAVVVHVDADILIVDEALSVGDAFFQAKCMSRMRKIVDSGTTVLFVSHDINAVKALCKRTLWLDRGIGRAFGETANVARAYAQDWIKQANAQHLLTDEDATQDSDAITPSETQLDNLKLAMALRFSARSGTGHAQYLAFQGFCGSDPIGVLPLEFGSLLRLTCLIEINESCERLVVAVHIKDSNNQHLVGVHSGMMLGLYDRSWQQGERFQIEFKLPVCLHAGRYAITALISSMADVTQYSDVKFFDWLEDVNVFEVAQRNPFPLSDLVEIEHEVKFTLS